MPPDGEQQKLPRHRFLPDWSNVQIAGGRLAPLLNALIEKIAVHEAVKHEDGIREQEVEIYYQCTLVHFYR